MAPADALADTDRPLVVGIDMGYGHMRPGTALADALGVELHACDRPPLAAADEEAAWRRARRFYEWATRWSTMPVVGAPLRPLVGSLTEIARLHPYRDLSKPTWPIKRLARSIRDGLGHRMVEHLKETGRPLLTTYFAPAHAADLGGVERIHCVVTDSDVHRIWAPLDPAHSRIEYLVPSRRTMRRLRAYGVAEAKIHVTGYPLPGGLLGGEGLDTLKTNLAARLVRLDPHRTFRDAYPDELRTFLGPLPEAEEGRPPLLTFAVGGAGAQTDLARRFLPGLRPLVEAGRLRLALVAGVRADTARELFDAVRQAGLEDRMGQGVEVLERDDLASYFRAFDALLARTDVLWTKPSELTFFGALGLALVLASPVGTHERHNRRWARESGAALKQRDARFANHWLVEWLEDGLLASAAWAGYVRLPKFGLYRIVEHVTGAHRVGRRADPVA